MYLEAHFTLDIQINDTLNKETNRKNVQIDDKLENPKVHFLIVLIHSELPLYIVSIVKTNEN